MGRVIDVEIHSVNLVADLSSKKEKKKEEKEADKRRKE